ISGPPACIRKIACYYCYAIITFPEVVMVKLATGLRLTALFAAVAGVLFSLIAATMSDPQTAAGMLTVSTDDMNASGLPLVLRVVVTVTPAVTFAYAMWQLARLLKLAAEG